MSVANRIGHTGWVGPDAFRMAQRSYPSEKLAPFSVSYVHSVVKSPLPFFAPSR